MQKESASPEAVDYWLAFWEPIRFLLIFCVCSSELSKTLKTLKFGTANPLYIQETGRRLVETYCRKTNSNVELALQQAEKLFRVCSSSRKVARSMLPSTIASSSVVRDEVIEGFSIRPSQKRRELGWLNDRD